MPTHPLIVSTLLLLFLLTSAMPPQATAAESKKNDLPPAARAILVKAHQLINDKAYAQATQVLADFQRTAPAGQARTGEDKGWFHAEVCNTLGICLLYREKYSEAAEALTKAVESDPNHQGAQVNLGKALYELGRHGPAAECFLSAYTIGGNTNPEYLYFAAVARMLDKHYAQAVPLFERLLAEHPAKVQTEWRENLIHALQGAGEHRRALPHIKSLGESLTGDKQRQWQEILLHQYLYLGMDEEALVYAEKLCATTPAEPKWWRALTHIHLQHNRYKEALSSLLITSYLSPPTPEEARLTADLYLQLGVPRQAVSRYKAMIGEKFTPQLLTNLLVALQQTGNTEEALNALEKFAPSPLAPDLALQRADLLFTLGRYQEAAKLYNKIASTSTGKQRDRALQMVEYAKARLAENG